MDLCYARKVHESRGAAKLIMKLPHYTFLPLMCIIVPTALCFSSSHVHTDTHTRSHLSSCSQCLKHFTGN